MADASTPPLFDAEAIVDAMAPLLRLAIEPAFRPGIVQNLTVMAALADLVLTAPLDEREEPAPVYRP